MKQDLLLLELPLNMDGVDLIYFSFSISNFHKHKHPYTIVLLKREEMRNKKRERRENIGYVKKIIIFENNQTKEQR